MEIIFDVFQFIGYAGVVFCCLGLVSACLGAVLDSISGEGGGPDAPA